MKGSRLLVLLLIINAILLSECSVEARNKGKTRWSNRQTVQRKQEFDPPQWMIDFGDFMDYGFDWMGYNEIPHFMRYAFVLTVICMPFWACFFIYCCVHNDEYDDEVEEMEFKERVKKAYNRKLKRLSDAKSVKFD